MTQEALKRIELIFQTEIKILKFPYPGLSHFSLRLPRPLLRDISVPPNCLEGLERVDFMRVGGLPRTGHNNLRMLSLCILIMAYEDSTMQLLKRIKHLAYDESQPLTYLSRQVVPEEFRSYYDDRLLRKLFVEFFHLVASRRSANKVLRFIEYHPILDFAFLLLFKRLYYGKAPSNELFAEHVETVELITVLFERLQLQPDIRDRRLRIGQYRYLAQDEQNTYLTCHRQDDLDIDFTQEVDSCSDSEEESVNTASTTIKMGSMKQSHCGSNQTKITEEEDPARWNTPIKQETPLTSQSMIPMRQTVQQPKTVQYFKTSAVQQNKGNCLEEYELRCGEIKDKLRKLETDVEHYNNPSNRQKTSKDETPTSNKIFPLCFKERQSERKMSSEYFENSNTFYREKNVASSNTANNTSISRFLPTQPTGVAKANELLPPRPPRLDTKSTRDLMIQSQSQEFSNIIRVSSVMEIPCSHLRTSSAFEGDSKNMTSSGLLLKEHPKKIMVRKI